MSLNNKNNNQLKNTDEQLTTKISNKKPNLILNPHSISSLRNHNKINDSQNSASTPSYLHLNNKKNLILYQTLFTQRNDLSLNNSSSKSKTIYDRSQEFIRFKQNKIKDLKFKLYEKESTNYPFTPKLSSNTNILSKGASSYRSYTEPHNNFYEQNIKWKEKTKKSLREKIINIQKKEYEDCSFHPCINNQSRYEQLVKKFKSKGGRETYDRQMKWMKKVNENKIKKEKEFDKKRTDKSAEYIKKNKRKINKQKQLNSDDWNLDNIIEEKMKKKIKERKMLTLRESISSNNDTLKNEMNLIRKEFIKLRMSLEENKLLKRSNFKVTNSYK